MAYDTQRARVLMMGGYAGPSQSVPTGLWSWDGSQWGLMGTAPNRYGVAMAYDSHRGRTVLFSPLALSSNTWEWVSTGNAYGAGCGVPPLSLVAVPTASPSINTTARASLSNVPSPLAFVSLGLSNAAYGPLTLPLALASIGMPGCNLLQSAELVGGSTTATGPTTATYDFAIPNNPNLVGLHIYLQAWAWAPGANPASIIVSNGLDWQIGY